MEKANGVSGRASEEIPFLAEDDSNDDRPTGIRKEAPFLAEDDSSEDRLSEKIPFLAEDSSNEDHLTDSDDGLGSDQPQSEKSPGPASSIPYRKKVIAVAVAIGIIVFFEAGSVIQGIPLSQVVEEIICRDVLGPGQPQDVCGDSAEVQAELADLRGWASTIDIIPSLLAAAPYGYFADKHGRKPTLVLSVAGMVLSNVFYVVVCWGSNIFPVRLTWLSSAWLLLGGGGIVFNSIFLSLIADVAPEAYRSYVFFYFHGVLLLIGLVFHSVASTLMQKDQWLPIFLGMGLFIPAFLLSLFLPETQPRSATKVSSPRQSSEPKGSSNGWLKTAQRLVRETISGFAAAAAALFGQSRHITLLLSTFLTTAIGGDSRGLLLQFARKSYGWTWASAGYLASAKSGVSLLLHLVLLPGATYGLARWARWAPPRRDLVLARASCAVLIVAAAIIGLSGSAATMVAGMLVWTFGNGYTTVLRSLLAALVPPDGLATLYSTVGVVESVGDLVAGPLLAAIFRWGMAAGWLGLPFLVAAALFALTLAVLLAVRLPPAAATTPS